MNALKHIFHRTIVGVPYLVLLFCFITWHILYFSGDKSYEKGFGGAFSMFSRIQNRNIRTFIEIDGNWVLLQIPECENANYTCIELRKLQYKIYNIFTEANVEEYAEHLKNREVFGNPKEFRVLKRDEFLADVEVEDNEYRSKILRAPKLFEVTNKLKFVLFEGVYNQHTRKVFHRVAKEIVYSY